MTIASDWSLDLAKKVIGNFDQTSFGRVVGTKAYHSQDSIEWEKEWVQDGIEWEK